MLNFLKKSYLHILCFLTVIGFILLSIFKFSNGFFRLIESLKDLFLSIVYLFASLIYGEDNFINPTINNAPTKFVLPKIFLPETWQGFVNSFYNYLERLFTSSNMSAYLLFLGNAIYYICIALIYLLPLFLLVYYSYKKSLKQVNNNYNQDTKQLIRFKKIVSVTYVPIKNFIINFINFVKTRKIYLILSIIIWCVNFNIFTIFIEFLAFYIYFIVSFDFSKIYFQVYKLILDLYVPFKAIPLFIWLILGYILFDKWRKSIGYSILRHNEMKDRGFINSLSITNLIFGYMGSGKTMALTDFSLSQEVMFRDEAFKRLLKYQTRLPNFPWVNFENQLKRVINNHRIYTLASTKYYIKTLKTYFEYFEKKPKNKDKFIKFLSDSGIYNYSNLIFDYDYKKYGLYYDDNLKNNYVWEFLETYAQLYFIYVIKTSLIIGNYSIRTDNNFQDLGNFPLWDNDFFTRDTKNDMYNKYSHIIDFDALRLGKRLVANNEYKDSLEFGVFNITEYGKERGNSVENQGIKKKDEETNVKNDGTNLYVKMARHNATVDKFPFVKIITDEQRASSLGANDRELGDVLKIEERTERRITLPFFRITDILCKFIYDKLNDISTEYRFYRGDNTLFMYILNNVKGRLFQYYERIHNTFDYFTLVFTKDNGSLDGQTQVGEYYVSVKKTLANRYETDCHSGFFYEKTLRSKFGLEDLPTYNGTLATWEELQKQNSYYINLLDDKKNEILDNKEFNNEKNCEDKKATNNKKR